MLGEGTEPRGKYQQSGGREDVGGECWEQRQVVLTARLGQLAVRASPSGRKAALDVAEGKESELGLRGLGGCV